MITTVAAGRRRAVAGGRPRPGQHLHALPRAGTGTAEVAEAPAACRIGAHEGDGGREPPRRREGRQPRGGDRSSWPAAAASASEDGFGPLRELAAALGGAVGASRAAADAGWIPYQLQIGQTGKVVKPALYIGAGISGAIQHRVGMQTAEHVIAINEIPTLRSASSPTCSWSATCSRSCPALTDEIRRRKGS